MRSLFNTVLIIFVVLFTVGNVPAAPTAAAIENWAYTFPDAAYELRSWSREHPATARELWGWNEAKRGRSRILVTWAIAHPGKSIDVFMREHADWTGLGNLLQTHRAAAKDLLGWCRQYPGAARALVKFSAKPLSVSVSGKN